MSIFTQKAATAPLGFAQTSTDQNLGSLVGARFETSDGREFVLVQNGGAALAQGKLVQGPAAIANHQGLVCSTQAIGDKVITVTLGGTAVTANQYAGGFINLVEGTGLGQTLKIVSHPKQTSTTGTVVLTLEDSIKVATSSVDTKGSLSLNPFGSVNGADVSTDGVIVCPVVITGQILGVSISPISASTSTVASYGFLQYKGLCALLNHSGTAAGLDVGNSTQLTPVAGACETFVATANSRIGTAIVAGVEGKYNLVNLSL